MNMPQQNLTLEGSRERGRPRLSPNDLAYGMMWDFIMIEALRIRLWVHTGRYPSVSSVCNLICREGGALFCAGGGSEIKPLREVLANGKIVIRRFLRLTKSESGKCSFTNSPTGELICTNRVDHAGSFRRRYNEANNFATKNPGVLDFWLRSAKGFAGAQHVAFDLIKTARA